MRIILKLCDNDRHFISLSQHYNHLIQAAIYRSISPSLSLFLHEKGFTYGKRAFKMFTFSRLLGKHRKEGNSLLFEGGITLHLSSPIERFIRDIANTMVRRGLFKVGTKELSVVELKFPEEPKIGGEIRIKTLSPITMYSTLFTQNGKKKTYYYSPYEKEFSRLVNENLKKKFYVLNNREIKLGVEISPIKVRECAVMYKDTVVRGWHGIFSLKGSISLIKLAYETGLGAKNSQGFGMFEVI